MGLLATRQSIERSLYLRVGKQVASAATRLHTSYKEGLRDVDLARLVGEIKSTKFQTVLGLKVLACLRALVRAL